MAKRSKKKRSKISKRKKISNKNKKQKLSEKNQDLIVKTKSDWIKKAIINKKQYEKKYSYSLKNNDDFWKKERTTTTKP